VANQLSVKPMTITGMMIAAAGRSVSAWTTIAATAENTLTSTPRRTVDGWSRCVGGGGGAGRRGRWAVVLTAQFFGTFRRDLQEESQKFAPAYARRP